MWEAIILVNILVPFIDKPFSNLICLHTILLFPSVEAESLLYDSSGCKLLR